jgi:hypothetical protein
MSVCYGAAAAALRSFSNTGACLFEQDERIDMRLIGCDMAFSLILWLPLSRESRYRFFLQRASTYNSHANWEKLTRNAGRPSMNPLDQFEISIRRKNDKIIAAVPQLGLYATATDIHGALDALEQKKAALLEDLTAAGELENLSPVAFANPVAPATSHGLARFTLKVGIIVVLIAIAIVITTSLVATKIEATRAAWQTTLQEHSKIGGAQFWSKVEQGLDQLADPKSEMPEDKRAKILSDIRAIRDRWWPFIAAAMPADAKSK